jgi:glycosyltransferase 2 family protein
VPVRRIVPVLLIGYLGNAVLPARLGEPIRAHLLARREGLSSALVFGTAVLERIIDLATLAIIAFAAALYLRPAT